jgi:hypothetical protein
MKLLIVYIPLTILDRLSGTYDVAVKMFAEKYKCPIKTTSTEVWYLPTDNKDLRVEILDI